MVMQAVSHDVWVPKKTVHLSPFAAYREAGQICNSAKSAVRALQVLELLARANRPLRAVEISGPLGLSPSTAYQLLKTLMDAAYLIFDPISKRYTPSPRIANLATPSSPVYFAPDAINQLMQALQDRFGGPIALTTSQGSFMQVIDVLWPSGGGWRRPDIQYPMGESSIGGRVPLFGSSVGAAWLASQSDDTVRNAIHLCRRELGKESKDVDAILARVHRIKAQGYAFGGMSLDDRIRGFSFALPPASNGIVLVIAMVGTVREMEERREEMAQVSKELIGQYLGA
jgi:DNA-binding IclR family transcriptional regulator